jgi:hypothetical protein
MLNPFAKTTATPAPTQATGPVFAGGPKSAVPAVDQRDMFKAQLKSGQINFNPNKPALPHFATKSWTA